jgi:phosphoserine phosphatase
MHGMFRRAIFIHMKKTIYFVRHGSTTGNEAGEYQLPTIELSEKGMRQARELGKRFKNIPLDIILTSEMNRAVMTAEAIRESTNAPMEKSELFHEILRPFVVRGKSGQDPEVKRIMDEVKSKLEDPSWHHSDEENFFDLKARGMKAVQYLTERPEENIAVVTHGTILRLMLGLITLGNDLTPQDYKKLNHNFFIENTGITMFKTYEDRLTLHTWNDYAHLGEISA